MPPHPTLSPKGRGIKKIQNGEGKYEIKKLASFFSEADLNKITDAEVKIGNPKILMACGDLFAIGCYLISKQNNYDAGRKACKTAMEALAVDGKLKAKILDKLDKNSLLMFGTFKPHIKVTKLFTEKQ